MAPSDTPGGARRVLVTGCAGFIGSNLCEMLLAEGYEVVGIDDLSAGLRENVPAGVELSEVDIRDPAAESCYAGVDAVFHLAAKNCLSDCIEDPVAAAAINVEGTVRVLEASRRAGVSKVVYADTSAAYEGVPELPSREDRTEPLGPYAISKQAGARFVQSHGRLHGLRHTILRYFNVYGPGQDYRRSVAPVMSAFILAILAGRRPVIYGSGHKRRDFVYVEDVNRFHLTCLRDPRTDGRIVNVGSGDNYSVLEIYDEVVELLKSDLRPVFRPDLPGEASETRADVSVARSMGFAPRIGLKEGLARSIEHCRSVVTNKESRR